VTWRALLSCAASNGRQGSFPCAGAVEFGDAIVPPIGKSIQS